MPWRPLFLRGQALLKQNQRLKDDLADTDATLSGDLEAVGAQLAHYQAEVGRMSALIAGFEAKSGDVAKLMADLEASRRAYGNLKVISRRAETRPTAGLMPETPVARRMLSGPRFLATVAYE